MVPLTQQLISSEFSSTRVSSFSMLSSKTSTEFQALLAVGFSPRSCLSRSFSAFVTGQRLGRIRTLTTLRTCLSSGRISRCCWTKDETSKTSRFRPVTNIHSSMVGSAFVQNSLSSLFRFRFARHLRSLNVYRSPF